MRKAWWGKNLFNPRGQFNGLTKTNTRWETIHEKKRNAKHVVPMKQRRRKGEEKKKGVKLIKSARKRGGFGSQNHGLL